MFNYEKYPSDREYEMHTKGYSFITNFRIEREPIYKEASKIHNLNYIIDNEAYTGYGKLIGDKYKAFYVDSSIKDLRDFWRTFEELSK